MSALDTIVGRLRAGAELRAGGTDVTARRCGGLAAGPFVDLTAAEAPAAIERLPDGSTRIGALTTIAAIAADHELRGGYPALTMTAGGLATPQIRAAATLGGNLLQRNRCWYYRNPHFTCFQTGGDGCPARDGLSLYSSVIDLGPCVTPHASSMAVALLAYDATVIVHGSVHGAGQRAVAALYGDGSDPSRDHLLAPGEVVLSVELPPAVPGERGAYHRAIARAAAEWPLVEAVARLVRGDDGRITVAAVAVGGVARIPLRLPAVELALVGSRGSPADLLAAARMATEGCDSLLQTTYKVGLLRDTVLEVLERASA